MVTWKRTRKNGLQTLILHRNGRDTGFVVYNYAGLWLVTAGSGRFDRKCFAMRPTLSTALAIAEKRAMQARWRW